jgi:glycosyltransferase involved in cell wall biosynthesis
MNNEDKLPMVSICCIAYNQQGYIKQALEGFLMQRTNFNFEVIIHDDASTDGTTEIIKDYAEKFPNIVKPIFQKQNKYSTEGLNFQYKYVFPYANGKYIAFCEGDDFWIDPLKLQKQVDFLENNKDYGLVHTRAVQFSQENNRFEKLIGIESNDFESLITENSISNLTVCLRNDLFRKYMEEVKPYQKKSWSTCDFPIWLWLILRTKFKFLNDITGVYRMIGTSISHHKDDAKRLKFYEGLIEILDYFLAEYNTDRFTKIIRARYTSMMISMYFLTKNKQGIRKSLTIFCQGNDWFNMFWILITMPFFYSRFFVKASYRCRNILFSILKIHSTRN